MSTDYCRVTTIVSEQDNPGVFNTHRILKSHNQSFGKTLRRLRLRQHMSQEALAFDAGLDRTYISLLELGRRSPTLDTLVALCAALDVSLVELVKAIEAALLDE